MNEHILIHFKHSSILGRSPTGGTKTNTSFVREAWKSFLRVNIHRVCEHFKKCVWIKIPLTSFVFIYSRIIYSIL